MNPEPRIVLQMALKSRNLITIYQGGLITKLQKHPMTKSEMFILNVKTVSFP
jgi:hypothetical protein